MQILQWIVAILLILAGLFVYFFLKTFFIPACRTEIRELQQYGGLFEGEDPYMGTFRIARTREDLIADERWARVAMFAILAGILWILGLIFW